MSTKSSVSTTIEGSVLVIELGTGGLIELDSRELSEGVRHAAMMAGLRSKVIDAAAIPRDTTTGKSATDAEKAKAIEAMVSRLRSGVWNVTSRVSKSVEASIFIRALAEVTGVGIDVAAARIKTLDKAQVKALRGNAKVSAAMARLAGANGDEVLDAFVGGLGG